MICIYLSAIESLNLALAAFALAKNKEVYKKGAKRSGYHCFL